MIYSLINYIFKIKIIYIIKKNSFFFSNYSCLGIYNSEKWKVKNMLPNLVIRMLNWIDCTKHPLTGQGFVISTLLAHWDENYNQAIVLAERKLEITMGLGWFLEGWDLERHETIFELNFSTPSSREIIESSSGPHHLFIILLKNFHMFKIVELVINFYFKKKSN